MAIGRPGPGTLAALAQMVALARANQRAPGHAGPLDVQNAAGQAGRQYQQGQQFNARLKQRQDEEAATAAHRAAVLQQGTDRTNLMKSRYAMDDERYADQRADLDSQRVAEGVAASMGLQHARTGQVPSLQMDPRMTPTGTTQTTGTGDAGTASPVMAQLAALGPMMSQQAKQAEGRAMATGPGKKLQGTLDIERRQQADRAAQETRDKRAENVAQMQRWFQMSLEGTRIRARSEAAGARQDFEREEGAKDRASREKVAGIRSGPDTSGWDDATTKAWSSLEGRMTKVKSRLDRLWDTQTQKNMLGTKYDDEAILEDIEEEMALMAVLQLQQNQIVPGHNPDPLAPGALPRPILERAAKIWETMK